MSKQINADRKLIIAPPRLSTDWQKTVTLILEHNKKDALGMVVNRPTNVSIREFGKDCKFNLDLDGVIYAGGPDDINLLSLIHSPEWSCDNTMQINDEISISSSRLVLEKLERKILPKKWKLVIGFTEWKNKQLDLELNGLFPFNKQDSWLISDATGHIVFGSDYEKQWLSAIEQSSKEFINNLF